MKYINYIILFTFLFFSGCASSIKPTGGNKLNGSQSKQKRIIQENNKSEYKNYSEVEVKSSKTNTVILPIVENGKTIATVSAQVIVPQEKRYIQLDSEVKFKKENNFNWWLFGRYCLIIGAILVFVIYKFGFNKVKNWIISPFKKKNY